MAAVTERACLAGIGALCAALLVAGAAQLSGALCLLITAGDPIVVGVTGVVSGAWNMLAALLAAVLCVAGRRHLWARSQLQLAALGSAAVVTAGHGVVTWLVPTIPDPLIPAPDPSVVATARLVSAIAAATAAAAAFAATNLAFAMQLLFSRYGPGAAASSSTKPTTWTGGQAKLTPVTAEMQQRTSPSDLWLPSADALASWVYRSQSSGGGTVTCETRLDAPADARFTPADARFTPARTPRLSCSGTSFAAAPAVLGLPSSSRRLSAAEAPGRRRGWPSSVRQVQSCSELEARNPTKDELDADRSHSSDALLVHGPSAEASSDSTGEHPESKSDQEREQQHNQELEEESLCSGPLHCTAPCHPSNHADATGAAGADVDTPSALVVTIRRLSSALNSLHSDSNYRDSGELQYALTALQQLKLPPQPATLTPTSHLPSNCVRPDSSASCTSSSGYGSPDGITDRPREGASICQQPVGGSAPCLLKTAHCRRRDARSSVGSMSEGGDRSRRPGKTERWDGLRASPASPPPNVGSGDRYQRRSVVQLVTMLEDGTGATWRRGADPRRPTVPPPPPPPPLSPTGTADAAPAVEAC